MVGPGALGGRSLRTCGRPAPLRPVRGPEERLDQLVVELVVEGMPKDPATGQRSKLLPSPARASRLKSPVAPWTRLSSGRRRAPPRTLRGASIRARAEPSSHDLTTESESASLPGARAKPAPKRTCRPHPPSPGASPSPSGPPHRLVRGSGLSDSDISPVLEDVSGGAAVTI